MIDVALKETEFVGQHLYITFIYPRFWLFWAITTQQNNYVHYNGYLFLHLIEIKHQWDTEKLTEQTKCVQICDERWKYVHLTSFHTTQSEGE